MFKKILGTFVALLFALSLAGCAQSFDSAGYAKSAMDALFKQELADFMKFTGLSEAEAREEYENGIKIVVDEIEAEFPYTINDEQNAKIREFVETLFSKASYEVVGATKVNKNEDTVEIKIKPVENLNNLEAVGTAYGEEFAADIMANPERYMEMTEEEAQNIFMNGLFDAMVESVSVAEYGDETTITINVKTDTEKKLRYIPDEDYEKIIETVIVMQ